MKNNGNYIWKGAVHEAIEPAGNVIYTDISINHKKLKPSDPDRNLNIYLNMKKNGIFFSPRDRFYYARELYYHGLFEAAAEEFEGFLSSGQGWLENELEAIKFLSECYHSMNDDIKALETLMRAFVYDTPRAEILCDIGRYFILFGKYRQAAYWYELALKCERTDKTGGFIKPDCYGYIPYIQLCVCYDMMGNKNKAEMYNEKAGIIKPGSASYLYNKRYFSEHLT